MSRILEVLLDKKLGLGVFGLENIVKIWKSSKEKAYTILVYILKIKKNPPHPQFLGE